MANCKTESLELTLSPEELRAAFYALETREDIAALLDIDDLRLRYHLYIADKSQRYTVFTIPKKSGGEREISAPISAIKIIQRKLNQVLQSVYQPKPSVHGFVHQRSIRTNAKVHSRRRYVLNIDLKDFFPTINFGRVRGMFMGNPYFCNQEVATVLTQICCFNNHLPQGAPTSPIVSNMICARLDAKLQQLAKKHKCTYSRYADDITFSTSQAQFPSALARLTDEGRIEVGTELLETISDNHFEINPKKVRLQTRYRRQEVTGLTVNKFPNVTRRYINQIRGMLHAWEKYGLESTQERYWQKYNCQHRIPDCKPPAFNKVVRGKIEFLGMVRGKHNPIYLRLLEHLERLAPELASNRIREASNIITSIRPLVITEGKTDWKHLKAALRSLKRQGLFLNLEIEFKEDAIPDVQGEDWMGKHCKSLSMVKQSVPTICISDRDVTKTTKVLSNEMGDFRDWGNNVYSFPIPVPSHRKTTPDISIEFYYNDEDIKRKDAKGRRLFLNSEFNQSSGRHLYEEDLICFDRNKVQSSIPKVIDHEVFDRDNVNIALTKDDFAENILNEIDGFIDLNVSEFSKIFEFINTIILDFDSGV